MSLPDDSRAIEVSKEIFEDENISNNLATIKANFKVLKEAIKELEERLPLTEALAIIPKVKISLKINKFKNKLDDVLNKNPGYKRMCQFGAVLSGDADGSDLQESPDLIVNFKYAPVTSVDCERVFSSFKDVLSCKRTRLTEQHLKDQMIIQWNKDLLQ